MCAQALFVGCSCFPLRPHKRPVAISARQTCVLGARLDIRYLVTHAIKPVNALHWRQPICEWSSASSTWGVCITRRTKEACNLHAPYSPTALKLCTIGYPKLYSRGNPQGKGGHRSVGQDGITTTKPNLNKTPCLPQPS